MASKALTPGPSIDLREDVLKSAGVSPAKLADLLQSAVSTLEDKLTATETKFFQHEGVVVEEREVEAHGIQMKAASEIVRLVTAVAALKGTAESGAVRKTPLAVQINVPPPVVLGEGLEVEAKSSKSPSSDIVVDNSMKNLEAHHDRQDDKRTASPRDGTPQPDTAQTPQDPMSLVDSHDVPEQYT